MKNCVAAAVAVFVSMFSSHVLCAAEPAADGPVEAVISHWIAGNREAALLAVKRNVQPLDANPGSSRGQVAELRNLGARIHYERYQRLAPAKLNEASEELRRAEVFAAAAVWEHPYDLTYWRDYVRIAAEQRAVRAKPRRRLDVGEALEKLRSDFVLHDIVYPDLGK